MLANGTTGVAQEPVDLGELQVLVGSRATDRVARLTRSVEVLGREELRALPVRTVQAALSWALGVDVRARSAAQADLSIRGGGFEEVLVLVDGVPVSDAQTGHFDLDLSLPLDQVERIEVLRGPAAALYGSDAVGGVVNLVTRRAVPVAVRVAGGSFGRWTVAASGGGAGERAGWSGSAEHTRSDGHRPGTDDEATLARARGHVQGSAGRVEVDLSHGRRAFGANGFYAPYDSFETTRTSLAVLRWTPTAAPDGALGVARGRGGSWTVEAWARDHRDDFVLLRDDPSFYRNRHTTRQIGVAAGARELSLGPLVAGFAVDAEHHDLESASLGDRAQDRAGAALELAASAGPVLASGGVRADWYDEFGTRLSPTVAMAWTPRDGRIRVHGAWGRAFRIPSWTERYYRDPANIADPDVRPERSWSVEAGIELLPFRAAGVEATVYRRRATDLIDWARPVGAPEEEPWVTRNVDRATFDGLELATRLPVAGVVVGADAHWLDVRSSAAPGLRSKYALRPLTRSVAARVEAPLGAGVSFGARIADERRAGEDDRVVADVRLGWDRGPWSVTLDVTNLGDAAYPDISGQPAPGRAVTLGVDWRLSPAPDVP
jgi:vitamin B12 transporter